MRVTGDDGEGCGDNDTLFFVATGNHGSFHRRGIFASTMGGLLELRLSRNEDDEQR